jgi:hypothetical protein
VEPLFSSIRVPDMTLRPLHVHFSQSRESDMRIMSFRRQWLAILIAISCLAAGCNALKDRWSSRGVPAQWEPGDATGDESP